MAPVTRTIQIRGLVQGVCYRGSAAAQARRLHLEGWIRNLPDGSVEALATGEPADLARFVAWCRQGPPAARVESVEVDEIDPPARFPDFTVRRS